MRNFFAWFRARFYPLFAVMDQALQSLVNLLSNVFIIRFAEKTEYGIYGIGFAALLLIMGVANALIMLQMTVIAPDREEGARDRYFASMLVSMYALCAAFIVVALLVTELAAAWIQPEYRTLIHVVLLSAPGILTIEFMRQYHYFHRLAHRVLIIDFLFFLLYFGALSAFIHFGFENIHLLALAINGGIAFVLGFGAILYSAKFSLSEALRDAWNNFVEAWRSGAWAVVGVFVSQMQGQGYIYLLALLRGPAAVAEMNAARLFLSPLLVMSNGFSRVIIPKMALLRSEGKVGQAVHVALKTLGLMLGMLAAYMLVVAVLWGRIEGMFASKGYQDLWIPVALWGVYYIGNSMANTPTELLKIFRKFRLITLAGMVTSVLVFTISIPAIVYFGIVGAIIVLAIGEFGLASLLWGKFRQVRRQYEGEEEQQLEGEISVQGQS